MLCFTLLCCYIFDVVMKPFLINLFMIISDSNFNLKWTRSTQRKNNAGLMDCYIHTNTDDRGSRIWCDSSQPSHGSLAFSRCLPLPSLPFALILSLKKRWVGRRALSEARRKKWHWENGKKGKENNTPWQQPPDCKPAAFWARQGLPQPFLHLSYLHISGSCPEALPAAASSCCRGAKAALRARECMFHALEEKSTAWTCLRVTETRTGK